MASSKAGQKRIAELKQRANAAAMIPSSSTRTDILNKDVLTDPMILEIESEKPVTFLRDPDQIIPHDQVPERLRNAIIETYDEQFFLEKEWTLGQLKRLHGAIFYPRENISNAIAQVCGPNCPMKDRCAYDIAGRPPIGERCPNEVKFATEMYNAYVHAVSEQYGTEEAAIRENIILHNLINGLVEADMIEARLNHTIAHNGFETQVPTAVNEQTGDVFYRDEESVAVRIKERVARRKEALFRQLIATPEMAAKYKRKNTDDAVARQTQLLDNLEKLVRSLGKGQS